MWLCQQKNNQIVIKNGKIALTGFEDISFEQTMTTQCFPSKLVHLRESKL